MDDDIKYQVVRVNKDGSEDIIYNAYDYDDVYDTMEQYDHLAYHNIQLSAENENLPYEEDKLYIREVKHDGKA